MDGLNFAMITGGPGICMKIAYGWFFHDPVPSPPCPLFFFFSFRAVLLSFAIPFFHRPSHFFNRSAASR